MNPKWANDRKDVKDLVQAVRAKCLNCSYDSRTEVDLCPCTDCPLYPYRLDGFKEKRAKDVGCDSSERSKKDGQKVQ